MKFNSACGLAVLFCTLVAVQSRAGDVTIDSVKVTKAGLGYQVVFSGKLTLTDIGGGYEKWSSVTCTVNETPGGTLIAAGISMLTVPTLTTAGSYTATVNVIADPLNANWIASATINYFVDNTPNYKSKTVQSKFTVP